MILFKKLRIIVLEKFLLKMPRCQDSFGIVLGCLAVIVLSSALGTLISGMVASDTAIPGAGCYRTCRVSDRRICSFELTVHRYQTLSRACRDCPSNLTHCSLPHCIPGNGVKRLVTVADKQMPGPSVQVCEGDTILMKVRNALPSSGVSLHWHGLSPSDPYMDGAGAVEPQLIPPQKEFRYKLDATQPGTHFWHSAAGFEAGDGLFGPVIVRQKTSDDIHSNLYDYDLPEHTVMINDWLHIPTMETFTLRHHSGGDHLPMDILINGRGRYSGEGSTPTSRKTPETVFNVQQNKRYRFRVISAAFTNCPVSFTISKHQFQVIATDGHPIVPHNASELILQPGERWDIVLHTDRQFSNYYILVAGLLDCSVSEANEKAVLSYVSSSSYSTHPTTREMSVQPYHQDFTGQTINPVSGVCHKGSNSVCLTDMLSAHPIYQDLTVAADVTLYLEFSLRYLDNPSYYDTHLYSIADNGVGGYTDIPSPQINNLSFSSLVPFGGEVSKSVCNINTKKLHCAHQFCQCVHMHSIPLGATVDLILLDAGGDTNKGQSVHLHGHSFRVLGQGPLPPGKVLKDHILQLYSAKALMNGSENPVLKDTVLVPSGGYTLVRFTASKPGYWPLHSQFLFHLAGGMKMILKVGEDSDLPQHPGGMSWCNER